MHGLRRFCLLEVSGVSVFRETLLGSGSDYGRDSVRSIEPRFSLCNYLSSLCGDIHLNFIITN